MDTKPAGASYQRWYARLLRLYPRAFRERFGETMAQSFGDLCRERREARRPLSGLVLWMFLETSLAIVKEHTNRMPQLGRTVLRVALGALAALMAPLVASRVVEGWNWPAPAFVRVYFLFFLTGMIFALVARKMDAWPYKAAVGVAVLAAFALGWSNMVQVADTENPANLVYYSVLVIGIVGACVARLRARGLAMTLFAMAATLAVISVVLPSGAPPDVAWRMAAGHAVYVAMFTAAGLLFRRASLLSASAKNRQTLSA